MSAPERIDALEAFVSATVGDGKSPNLFFVSDRGVNVMITRNFDDAYATWKWLAIRPRGESALEDRQYGVMASVSPVSDEPGARLEVRDDACAAHREIEGRVK